MAENKNQELNDDVLNNVAGGDLGIIDKGALVIYVADCQAKGLTLDQAITKLSEKINVKDSDYFEAIGIIYTIWNGNLKDLV